MTEMRRGAKETAEATEGRVELRFFPGGVMGNDKSVLRKIRFGQLHGGALTAGGLIDVYAGLQVYSLPLVFRDYDEVDFVRRHMDPVLREGLAKSGFASYGFSETGFAYLMSNHTIATVKDLRAGKVWTIEGDPIGSRLLQSLEVSPIPLPISDVLTGLQTGLIDTVTSTPVAAIALQWHTRIDYLTDIPLLYSFGTLIVDEKALADVSEADRQALQDAMTAAVERINAQSRQSNRDALAVLRERGVEFVEPGAEAVQAWRDTLAGAIADLADEGVIDPELLDRLRELLAEHRQGG
jgi:TRAP-type C4-dicarboxylate transport system substrate-binding protein